ncbi:MAG: PfkB family carbohydrate kinase [Puniceicoccales bacterium]|jgi:D-beta-D-heptose 7-phosphate kinase/D-beta-D-heptose 1-phosphate adenosyltransferase|nr:PfkB family carbohydrate kinase [Puniceicoccales bacterium]
MEALPDLLRRMAQLRILVIGDVMLDHYISGEVFRLSPEAPVPVIAVEHERHALGAAANVAHNLSSLGIRTQIWGSWGRDAPGLLLEDLLQKAQVNPVDGSAEPGVQTILKTRIVARQQQLCRLDREEAPEHYRKDLGRAATAAPLEKALAEVDAVILSDYAKGLIDQPCVDFVADYARRRRKILAWDPKPKHALRFPYLTLMTPNRSEAFALAGEPEEHRQFPAERICQKIFERHRPEYLLITLGEEGMLLSRQGELISRIPTYAQEVFDVSGAGDTVVALLTAALAAEASPEEAAHLANRAAGLVVAKRGTAVVTPAELMGSF